MSCWSLLGCNGDPGVPAADTGAAVDTASSSQCVEDSTRVCGRSEGECSKGTQTCENGSWSDCEGGQSPAASDNTCDGRDNDCDGQIDEDCSCNPGDKKECATGRGACESGLKTCRQDGTWGDCEGAVGEENEVCDGVDNDCDGKTDEELTRRCGREEGICRKGTETCEDGSWSDCRNAIDPKAESCNGRDDDCDGDVDELLSKKCGTDTGVCQRGTDTCKSGRWTGCQGAHSGVKSEEQENRDGKLCDKKDNDCDGKIDEGCDCRDGQTRDCGPTRGSCRAGTQACSGGTWGACTGGKKPGKEVCDGKDNDCDGTVDNGLRRECGKNVGVCRKGTETCVNGSWSTCNDVEGSAETCNGRDDNCNNAIDENLVQNCPNQKGVCQGADVQCQSGRYPSCGGAEYGTHYEKAESSCGDGRDNDCDGQTDCADVDCGGVQCAGPGTGCAKTGGSCRETACRDDVDNDADGDSDCQDADCPGCGPGASCTPGGVCKEDRCGDGKDNDNDGKTDCADSDCRGFVCTNTCPHGEIRICQNDRCARSNFPCPR